MSYKRVMSGLRYEAVALWLCVFVVATIWMFVADLRGEGLRHTTYFRLLGSTIYPVYYGCMAYLIYWLCRRLSQAKEYLKAVDDTIQIGDTVIPMTDLTFEIRRNWVGLREVVFRQKGKQVFAAKAYFFARPLSEVCDELNYVIQRTAPRS